MFHFHKFFEDLTFFKTIEIKSDDISKRLYTYLKDPSNIVFQQEIDEWLKIAYEHKIVDYFKKRLSGNITSIDLSCILNELMVAHFVHTILNMRIKQYSPAVKDNKMADWLFEKDNQEIYVEVKTPWEERREGTFFYSQYDKLFESIRKKYSQRPENKKPFVVFVTDELNLTPTIYSDEIEDALYGERGTVLNNYENGRFKNTHFEVIDKRSIFQRKIRRGLSAVAALKFMVVSKYRFVVYHNPYCHEVCKLNSNWFKPFRQYVPNFEKSEMEWIGDIR